MACGAFNVLSNFGVATPSGGVVQRSRRTRTVEWDEIDGPDGEVALACPFPYGREVVEISGRGNVAHVTLAGGTVLPGTHIITSRSRREFNVKQPEFTVRSESLFDTEDAGS